MHYQNESLNCPVVIMENNKSRSRRSTSKNSPVGFKDSGDNYNNLIVDIDKRDISEDMSIIEKNDTIIIESFGKRFEILKEKFYNFKRFTKILNSNEYKKLQSKQNKYVPIKVKEKDIVTTNYVQEEELAIHNAKNKVQIEIYYNQADEGAQKKSAKIVSPKESQSSTSYYNLLCACIIIIFIVLFMLSYLQVLDSKHSNKNRFDKKQYILAIRSIRGTIQEKLKPIFPNQEETFWQEISTRFASIAVNPVKPAIIVLIGNEKYNLLCLSTMLTNISSNILHGDKLFLPPNKFAKDQGKVLSSLTKGLLHKNSVIIWDLMEINVEALKAFHSLCDTFNPVEKEVVFIITVIDKYISPSDHVLTYIEEKLTKKLIQNQFDIDSVQPLVVRITDGAVLYMKPESTIDCPVPMQNY